MLSLFTCEKLEIQSVPAADVRLNEARAAGSRHDLQVRRAVSPSERVKGAPSVIDEELRLRSIAAIKAGTTEEAGTGGSWGAPACESLEPERESPRESPRESLRESPRESLKRESSYRRLHAWKAALGMCG